MTFTFSLFAGLKETTEQLVKKKLEGRDKLTPWEDFLEKKKDRKKQKKKSSSQRKQVSQGAGCDAAPALRRTRSQTCSHQGDDGEELSDDQLPADVDLSDPFFAEELAATGTVGLVFLFWSGGLQF